LNHIINDADAERLAQKKEFDRVKNERDIWGTQLIRRNEELALLYEKIKIQQSTLTKGETQYHERLEDIRILKVCFL
jgi:SET domain-containing protein